MSKLRPMPATEWIPTIFGGAIFGGVFWMILSARTTFFEPSNRAHGEIPALISAVAVAVAGTVIHLIPNRKAKSLGLMIVLGALLGLPVLGYLAAIGN